MTGAVWFVRAQGWKGRRSAQDRVQPWRMEADRTLLGSSSHLCLFLRLLTQEAPLSQQDPRPPPTISPAHVSDVPRHTTWFPVQLAASLNDPAWLSHTSVPLNGSRLCLGYLPSLHGVHPCSSSRTQLIDATPSKASQGGFQSHPRGS